MSAWLYSIIGIVFLGVLIDVLYPNGKTNNFCKSIFGLITTIVLVSPILKLKIKNPELSNNYINSTLVSTIQSSKDEINQSIVTELLKNQGISGINVEINSIMQNNEYVIENIFVDTTNVVLNKDMEHTYMYEVILESIMKQFNISSEKVFIYG